MIVEEGTTTEHLRSPVRPIFLYFSSLLEQILTPPSFSDRTGNALLCKVVARLYWPHTKVDPRLGMLDPTIPA
jgi:hypothetical protein